MEGEDERAALCGPRGRGSRWCGHESERKRKYGA